MLKIDQYVYDRFNDVQSYGNPISDLRVNCPFCSDRDMKHHLYISLNKKTVHCFRCGYSNTWLGFVADNSKCSYSQAYGKLYAPPKAKDFEQRMAEFLNTQEPIKKSEIVLPKDFKPLSKTKKTEAREHKDYLIRRKFYEDVWERYNLGYSKDYVPHRVIIPVENGLYYQARSIYSWLKPKYDNPKCDSRSYIFNASALDLYDEIAICEGAFSAMAIGENAVALLGKEATQEKLSRLAHSRADRFIIALEPGAFGTMDSVAKYLSYEGKEVIIWEYQSGDPADGKLGQVLEYDFAAKVRLRLNT